MTLVTLADACARLPELIALVAGGEQVVIVQNNVVLAELAPPPFQLPTPVEEVAKVARREQLIREWLGLRADAPVPRPGEMTHEEYIARYREAG